MIPYLGSFPLAAADRLGRRPEIAEILIQRINLVATGPVTYARIAPLIKTCQDHVTTCEKVKGNFFYLTFDKSLRVQSRADLTGRFTA